MASRVSVNGGDEPTASSSAPAAPSAPAVLPADSLAEGITTDALTTWFDDIEDRLSFRMWLFGHYHTDVMPDTRHRALYRDIVSVNELLAESGRA